MPFIQPGVSLSSSAAGLVTNTVPQSTSNITEKARMSHMVPLPRYTPDSSAMDAPPWRELIMPAM